MKLNVVDGVTENVSEHAEETLRILQKSQSRYYVPCLTTSGGFEPVLGYSKQLAVIYVTDQEWRFDVYQPPRIRDVETDGKGDITTLALYVYLIWGLRRNNWVLLG